MSKVGTQTPRREGRKVCPDPEEPQSLTDCESLNEK